MCACVSVSAYLHFAEWCFAVYINIYIYTYTYSYVYMQVQQAACRLLHCENAAFLLHAGSGAGGGGAGHEGWGGVVKGDRKSVV